MLNMVKSYSFTISLTLEGEATSGPTIRLEFRQSNDRINLTNETKFSAISCALYFAGSLNNSGSTIYTLCILYDHGNISSNMLATNTIDYNALSCIVCLTTVRCIGLSLNVIVLFFDISSELYQQKCVLAFDIFKTYAFLIMLTLMTVDGVKYALRSKTITPYN